jgi:hypothetical protein
LGRIGHALSWRQSFDADESVGCPCRELLDQRGFAYAAPATARYQYAVVTPPQSFEILQVAFSANKHDASFISYAIIIQKTEGKVNLIFLLIKSFTIRRKIQDEK